MIEIKPFSEFIVENALTFGELSKYPFRFDVFKSKVEQGETFELDKEVEGLKFVTIDKDQFTKLETIEDVPKTLIVKELEKPMAFGKLKKTLEFGGGKSTGNKGNEFENELANEMENYYIKGNTEEVVNREFFIEFDKIIKNETVTNIKVDGGLNQKRPLKITSSKITAGELGDIGKTVTDLTVTTNKNTYYLSLKYGSTVTFVNAGVAKILSQKDMQKNDDVTDKKGVALLNMLGMDSETFAGIFNNYVGGCNTKTEVNITSLLNKNNIFKKFMESVIGYGYVMVHKEGAKIHTFEMTKRTMMDFIAVNKATLVYPEEGCTKRMDVKIEMNGMNIKINIRNKNGKVYPSNIMADYKITH